MRLRYRYSFIFLLPLLLVSVVEVRAGGVAVVDASQGTYLTLSESNVLVSVENQVAIVTTTQVFFNPWNKDVQVKYAFPVPEGASPTALRWQIDGVWYDALFASSSQDNTLPGTGYGIDADLRQHLGETPLFFDIVQPLHAESFLTVQMTYVQLLPYTFGHVDFFYPNDYSLIQTAPLDAQNFTFNLASLRTIELLDLHSHTPTSVFNDGATGQIKSEHKEERATTDYHVRYRLSLDELGIFDFSTFLPDSAVVDEGGNGFFAFVAEPDPSENTEVIDKVFTLIVDRSGSMGGDKIVQARNAASFVVNNLNTGDRFNIVDFNQGVLSFRPEHVPFTPTAQTDALEYIDGLQAGGSTNISGAFSTAMPQFASADEQTANIIIFFTDGHATTGITSTEGILNHVRALIDRHETNVVLFTFGIGPRVDRQLLTLLATENDGLVEFLGDDELEARITAFYLKIRNPVLLNTQIAFTPPVGTVLYTVCSITRCSIEEFSAEFLPFFVALVVVLLLLTFAPPLVTVLPDMLF